MRTRFYIERRLDEGGDLLLKDRPVFMSVSFGGERLMLSTGVKSDMQAWDPERQMMKEAYPGAESFNTWLSMLDETAGQTWKRLSVAGQKPSTKQFRTLFNELKPNYSGGFFDAFYLFMEEGIKSWSTATYRKVKTIFAHLREYEDQTGERLRFTGMDAEFPVRFSAFYRGKGNGTNTTLKAINILVWFLNWAGKKGYYSGDAHRSFYRMLEKTDPVPRRVLFLHGDELQTLGKVRTESRREERALDLFRFMCFSGLRYSELKDLKKEDIRADHILVRGGKGRVRRLPLNIHAAELMRKYADRYYLDNAAFPPMHLITLNKYIRVLSRRAGLDRRIPNADGSLERVPLHEKITAAAAVHTFIASAVELGISYEVIAGITGVRNSDRARKIKKELKDGELARFNLS